MAEAVVESAVPPRFYCHMCNVEINIPNTDFTCPLCAGGFVEELPRSAPPTPSTSGGSGNADAAGGGGAAAHSGMPWVRASDLEDIRREIVSLIAGGPAANVEISIDPGNRRGNLLTLGGGSSDSAAGNSPLLPAGGRVRPQHLDRLDNVLLDFLQTLSQTGNVGDVDMESGAATFGPNHMFFMGNPGDYAWGREGIDTIVTQLLNQMETSGPPPLAKDKIAEIPKVAVTLDDVNKKLQCSVCWEDFTLGEEVRKLPCLHIYHENCIVPWLDLHGTCPICRKSLIDDSFSTDAESAHDSFTSASGAASQLRGANVCPLHRNLLSNDAASSNAAATTTSSAAASTHAPAQQTSASSTERTAAANSSFRNNIFGFDDDTDNVDLD